MCESLESADAVGSSVELSVCGEVKDVVIGNYILVKLENKKHVGHFTEMSTQKNCRVEIVYDSLLHSLSILLLAVAS